MIVFLWEKNKQFKAWVKRNGWKGIVVELSLALSLGLGIYIIGRNYYMETLNSGQNCFCKTNSVFIDKTAGYLNQVGFKFTDYKNNEIIGRYAQHISISSFDFSRTYTVRYLCDTPKYKELLLEDWDESRYVKDNKGRYLLK